MANPYYNPTGTPITLSSGLSALIRAEFAAIAAAFGMLPSRLTGNAGALVVVNWSGTGLSTTPPSTAMQSQALTNAGLVTAPGNLTAAIGATNFYASVNGKMVLIVSGTIMPALTGCNTPAGFWFNVACFSVNAAGVVTMTPGVPATTIGGVQFAPLPPNTALIGILLVSSNVPFTGGTSLLNVNTSTVYFNSTAPFNPSVITG